MEKKASVIVDNNSVYTDRVFSYKIPNTIDIEEGQRVIVPFGRGNKKIEGFVWSIEEANEEEIKKLKEIESVLENRKISSWAKDMVSFIRESCLCTYMDAINLVLPKSIRTGQTKKIRIVSLNEEYQEPKRLGEKQKSIIDFLKINKVVQVRDLNEIFPACQSTLKSLESKGIVTIFEEEELRLLKNTYNIASKEFELRDFQEEAISSIIQESNEEIKKPVLLHGITGSGKTEVYMEILESVLKNGKEAIILVPEISLTPQTIGRFKARFKDVIAVIHSELSPGERHDQWLKIERKEAKIVIGARSAIFAPFENLGLIIVDECHESSYKSEMSPKYDAIEVAIERGKIQNSLVILGSATPNLKDYYKSQKGEYKLVKMTKRANEKPLPEVEIVDMRSEIPINKASFLSKKLLLYIEEALNKNEQIILFLNRRGYASFLTCQDCGYVYKCKNCDISLTYHKGSNKGKCHYCGYQEEVSVTCPECESFEVKDFGIGTERLQEEIQEIFKEAKILRMDRDTVKKKGDHEKILSKFKDQEADILIGTQMIGKGLDFPKVSLVGIISVDQTLFMPDYHSAEITFQTISQVAGRAGRDEIAGKVVLQTLHPDNYVINYAKEHDYEGFYKEELSLRKEFAYSPFGAMIHIVFTGISKESVATSAMKTSDAIKYFLKKRNSFREEAFLGPSPCLIERIDKKYRWQLIIKHRDIEIPLLKSIIRYMIYEKRDVILAKNVFLSVDFDSKNFL